jgi:hypothetical protein
MLNKKNVLDYFWAEAIATTMYIMNRTPTIAIHRTTHEEKFTWKKLIFLNLRMFSCFACVNVLNEKKKIIPKGGKCIFIGYSLTTVLFESCK